MSNLKIKIEIKLAEMKRKPYMVNGRQHRIISYRFDGEMEIVTVVTDNKGWWEWDYEEALKQLGAFLPIEDSSLPAVTDSCLPPAVINIENRLGGLVDTIFENIDLVKKDPQYIPQAHAVNKSINALVQLGRLNLEINKLGMKMNG